MQPTFFATLTHCGLRTNSGDGVLSILPPAEGKHRARKVVTRSRARPTGKYPSWKMDRMVHWESVNELNAFRLFDANPLVRAFYEQPCCVRFRLHGEEHLHYPDALVLTDKGSELCEIKTAGEAARDDCVARTGLLSTALPRFGFTYRVLIAEELRREPRLSNVLKLLRFGKRCAPLLEQEHFRRILESCGCVSWENALRGELGHFGRSILARSFFDGIVEFNVDLPLTPSTKFWRRCARGAG